MATILREEKKVFDVEGETKKNEKDPEQEKRRKENLLINRVISNCCAAGYGTLDKSTLSIVDAGLYKPFKFMKEYNIDYCKQYIEKALNDYNRLVNEKKIEKVQSNENTELGIMEKLNAVKAYRKERNAKYKLGSAKV